MSAPCSPSSKSSQGLRVPAEPSLLGCLLSHLYTMAFISFSRWSRCTWVLGVARGLRTAWTEEWVQCVALLQVSQQCWPFCWWLGREIRYRSFVSHELSSHFWTTSAMWLYVRENMGEECCFVVVFFFFPSFLGVEMCSVRSCLTLWDFLQSWLDALARKAWQAPNQAGPAEYYKQ